MTTPKRVIYFGIGFLALNLVLTSVLLYKVFGKQDVITPPVPEATNLTTAFKEKEMINPTQSQAPKNVETNHINPVPGKILVNLKSKYSKATDEKIRQTTGLTDLEISPITDTLVEINSPQLAVQQEQTGTTQVASETQAVIEKIKQNPIFEEAEPDVKYYKFDLPNDPYLNDQWHIKNTGQTTNIKDKEVVGKPGVDLNLEPAWQIETGKEQTIVAVIDDGVDITHPDLQDAILKDASGKVIGYDFYNDKPYENPTGEYGWGHGTHVAGAIAARANNQQGVSGVCQNCKIMPIKFLGEYGGSTSGGVKSIYFAVDNGAKVINASWGSSYGSPSLQKAIKYAQSKGVSVIAAAGNSNSNTQFYPASFPESISVAAIGADGKRAFFSTYNADVDVAAPGYRILSTLPVKADLYGEPDDGPANECEDRNYGTPDDGYGYCSGTSMAAPLVTGVAALLASQNPEITPQNMLAQLKFTTQDIYQENPDFVGTLGTGRVDAFQALSQNSSYQAVISGVEVDDTKGNKNGLAEPGENIQVKIKIQNGWKPAQTAKVEITEAITNLGISPKSETVTNFKTGAEYVFTLDAKVDQNIIDSTDIKIPVKVTLDGTEFNLETVVKVEAVVTGPKTWTFDQGSEGWSTSGNWYLENKCESLPDLTGLWHFGTKNCGGYENYQSGRILSPRIKLNDTSKQAVVELDYALDNEFYGSTENGYEVFDFARPFVAYRLNNYEYTQEISLGESDCGSNSLCGKIEEGSKRIKINIPSTYLNKEWRIGFNFSSDGERNFKGWFVDKVNLTLVNNQAPKIIKASIQTSVMKGSETELNLIKEAGISDIENDTLTYTVIQAENIEVNYIYSGVPTLRARNSKVGPALLRYSVSDGKGGVAEGLVQINVTPRPNTAPTISKPDLIINRQGGSSSQNLKLTTEAGITDNEKDNISITVKSVTPSPAYAYISFDTLYISSIPNSANSVVVNYEASDGEMTTPGKVTINLTQLGRINGRVWLDGNSNNLQDIGEFGLNQVKVNLREYTNSKCQEQIISSTQTNTTGAYILEGALTTKTYCVEVIAPDNYDFVDKNVGGNAQIDSDMGYITQSDNTKLLQNYALTKNLSSTTANIIDAGLKLKSN
ncbi:MAG: hypothetical protein OHK0017_01550 [Patescibacteria group bacterium]